MRRMPATQCVAAVTNYGVHGRLMLVLLYLSSTCQGKPTGDRHHIPTYPWAQPCPHTGQHVPKPDSRSALRDKRLHGDTADPQMCGDMCAYCSNHSGHAISRCVTLPWRDGSKRTYYQCHACGFIFNPREDINENKREAERATAVDFLRQLNLPGLEYQVSKTLENWKCHARERIVTIQKEARKPRALEIGSALGFMASIFRAEGWEVEGREMWPAWRDFADRYLQVPSSGELLQGEGSPYYDLIYCTQVIEHVADFIPFLSAMRSRLLPNGMLYVSTTNANVVTRPPPNAEGIVDLTRKGHHGADIFDNALHINHWSRESLHAAAIAVGFDDNDVYTLVRGEHEWELAMFAMKRGV